MDIEGLLRQIFTLQDTPKNQEKNPSIMEIEALLPKTFTLQDTHKNQEKKGKKNQRQDQAKFIHNLQPFN